jgi:hypothetical protein
MLVSHFILVLEKVSHPLAQAKKLYMKHRLSTKPFFEFELKIWKSLLIDLSSIIKHYHHENDIVKGQHCNDKDSEKEDINK